MSLERRLAGFFGKFGIALGPGADPKAICALVKRLRPKQTDRPLIRVGGDSDGGYLVPDCLQGIVACFSPGVSRTATFEEDLAAKGMPCYLADASVDAPPVKNSLFYFTKRYLGAIENETTVTLDTWVKANAPAGDLLLQMDIEGCEWEVLLSSSRETMLRFRIVVLEVHSIWQMMGRFGLQIMKATFDKLLQDFDVVHLHPNNVSDPIIVAGIPMPAGMEMTFIRKGSANIIGPATRLPHPLDRRNVSTRPDLILSPEWVG